jgi:hypothetical protein
MTLHGKECNVATPSRYLVYLRSFILIQYGEKWLTTSPILGRFWSNLPIIRSPNLSYDRIKLLGSII